MVALTRGKGQSLPAFLTTTTCSARRHHLGTGESTLGLWQDEAPFARREKKSRWLPCKNETTLCFQQTLGAWLPWHKVGTGEGPALLSNTPQDVTAASETS